MTSNASHRANADMNLTDLDLIVLDAALMTESARLLKIIDEGRPWTATKSVTDQDQLVASARRCLHSNEVMRGRDAQLIDEMK